MKLERRVGVAGFLAAWIAQGAMAQADPAAARAAIDAETLRHFQALVRMDTTSPPGNEKPAADYVAQVLEREGIPVQTFAVEARRPNVVARLTGNGRKRPLLLMGHTDTVNVDPAKWQHPPFSAARDGAHIYGRGTVDDKDSVTAALMTMLLLKRNLVALDRDVIFLAEAGEEGNTEVGIAFMVEQHYDAIDAEYCLAEAGNVVRVGGEVSYADVQTAEKFSKGMDLIARGVAGHGSVPLESNPIARLARAVNAVTQWQPPVVLNDTTRAYFARLGEISEGAAARRYRDVLSSGSRRRRRGRCLAARQRPDQSLDAADLDLADYRAGRLPQQRHPLGGACDARRAHASRRRRRGIPPRARAPDR